MDFGFNQEQKSLGEVVSRVLADFRGLTASEPTTDEDWKAWDALAQLGLFSLLVPEEHDGVGLSLVDIALAVEALGAGLAPAIVSTTLIATDLLARFGTERQKEELLPRIAAGQLRISLAVHEAAQGYNADVTGTMIEGNHISGAKILVPGAEQADCFLVLAAFDGWPGLALVWGDAGGLSLRAHDDLDPSSGLCELRLDAATLPDVLPLGRTRAAEAVARLYDVAATVYAGLETGIAGRMLDASVEYACTRQQFGQPIGAFQAIKHRCADMAVALEAARSAAYYAFWAVSEDASDRARASSMAKAYCGEVVRDATNEAIQIHGGMGFTWELGLHRFLRRARVLEHSFGAHDWHYERVMQETLILLGAPSDSASTIRPVRAAHNG